MTYTLGISTMGGFTPVRTTQSLAEAETWVIYHPVGEGEMAVYGIDEEVEKCPTCGRS